MPAGDTRAWKPYLWQRSQSTPQHSRHLTLRGLPAARRACGPLLGGSCFISEFGKPADALAPVWIDADALARARSKAQFAKQAMRQGPRAIERLQRGVRLLD